MLRANYRYEVGASDGQLTGKLHADASGNPAPVLALIQTGVPGRSPEVSCVRTEYDAHR